MSYEKWLESVKKILLDNGYTFLGHIDFRGMFASKMTPEAAADEVMFGE